MASAIESNASTWAWVELHLSRVLVSVDLVGRASGPVSLMFCLRDAAQESHQPTHQVWLELERQRLLDGPAVKVCKVLCVVEARVGGAIGRLFSIGLCRLVAEQLGVGRRLR